MHPTRLPGRAVILVSAAPAFAAFAAESAPARPSIRIKTGITEPLTDETGVKWEANRGFADGDTIARPDIEITGTNTPSLYRAVRYSMTKFTQALPNDRYTV